MMCLICWLWQFYGEQIQIKEMIFIGDALFPGGNDYPAKESGAFSVRVSDPNETKRVIEGIIGALDNGHFGEGFE